MAKKYIARIDNIVYHGKIYNRGDQILVDDNEKMNEYRWMTEAAYKAEFEKIVKSTADLTDKEAKKKITDLTAKLDAAEKENAELKKQLETVEQARADAEGKLSTALTDVEKLQKQVKDLTAKLDAASKK